MITNLNIKLTLTFNPPDLDSEERDEQEQQCMAEWQQTDEVNAVKCVLDPNPPKGNKAIGEMLVGLLTAEVSVANARKLMDFLGDRLGDKPTEPEVEENGKKLKVSAHSREELESAIEAAKETVAA